jgi:fructose-1,6-bisphosphatase II / sedoheptulose-1,7-bisphosphatase
VTPVAANRQSPLAMSSMLSGVKFRKDVIETETVVMRSVTGTVRYIKAEHRQLDKFHLD